MGRAECASEAAGIQQDLRMARFLWVKAPVDGLLPFQLAAG